MTRYCCGKRSSDGGTGVQTLSGAEPSGRGRGSGGSPFRFAALASDGLRRGSGAVPRMAGTELSSTSSAAESLSGGVTARAAGAVSTCGAVLGAGAGAGGGRRDRRPSAPRRRQPAAGGSSRTVLPLAASAGWLRRAEVCAGCDVAWAGAGGGTTTCGAATCGAGAGWAETAAFVPIGAGATVAVGGTTGADSRAIAMGAGLATRGASTYDRMNQTMVQKDPSTAKIAQANTSTLAPTEVRWTSVSSSNVIATHYTR